MSNAIRRCFFGYKELPYFSNVTFDFKSSFTLSAGFSLPFSPYFYFYHLEMWNPILKNIVFYFITCFFYCVACDKWEGLNFQRARSTRVIPKSILWILPFLPGHDLDGDFDFPIPSMQIASSTGHLCHIRRTVRDIISGQAGTL